MRLLCRSVHECWGVGDSLADCIAAVQQRPVGLMAPYLAEGHTFCIRVHAYGHSFSPQQQHDIVQQFRFLPVQSTLSFTAPEQRFWVFFDFGDERHRTAGVEPQTRRVYFCRELAVSGKFVHQYSLKTRPYIGPTSMPADLSFLYANQALASSSKLVYDPFVGTGSLLVACAHFGATVVGADLDWKILHGMTVGGRAAHHTAKGSKAMKSAAQEEQAEQEDEESEADEVKQVGSHSKKRLRIDDNFRHYKLPRPELICSDQSLPVWARAEVFDAVVSDPPYGVRAGARRSGRKGEAREVPAELQANRIPPSQQYDVEDVVDDLLDMAARTLKLNGRLVYLLPTTTDFSNDELPRHPCLRLVCVSEQIVRTHFSRRLITMEKSAPWSPGRNIVRRDRTTQPSPKYANIKDALLLAAANAAIVSPLAQHDDDKRESKRAVKRQQRYVAKREHKQRVKEQGGPTAFPPDAILLFNACIYADCSPATFADPYTWMVIRQERVLAIGRLAAPMSEFAESERRRNMEGKVIVPGLIDSHIHVYLTGKLQHNIDLTSCNTIQELQQTVQLYHQQHPPPATPPTAASPSSHHWLFGFGFEHDRFGRYPCAADVDAVVAEQPVFLWRACYHVAVVNTTALRLAGITAETADPPGGSIDRDEQGRPTGLLREKAAGLVEKLIVETVARRRQYVEVGLEYCLSMGLTCVQTNDEGCWSTYKQLADEGKLPLRVFLTIMHAEMGVAGQPKAGEEYGPLLSCHRIKMFADGALGAETAALTQPYVHRCAHSQHSHSHGAEHKDEEGEKRDNYGILIYTQDDMDSKVKQAHELGYRIEMHVIGDRAAEMAIHALKAAATPPTARPILTHCQVLSASLLHDMKELNVVADIQPQFATTDCRWVDDRLSPSLQRYAYIWRTLKEGGIHCAGGSDSPIEVPSPFEGMHAAVFRPRRQYRDMRQHKQEWMQLMRDSKELSAAERDERLREWCGGSWVRGECLDVRQALELYTADGAYCAGKESELGVLAAGFMADFVVVDCDFVRDPHALLFATAEEVWVAGVRRK